MKYHAGLIVGAVAVLLSGCCTTPGENYQQAYEDALVDGQVMMLTLRTLDSGDIRKTRHVGITGVHVTLWNLTSVTTQAKPTPEQKQEEIALARDVLDYMLEHRDEFYPRLGSVRMGVRALQKILTQEDDVRRLTELVDYLAEVEKELKESSKP